MVLSVDDGNPLGLEKFAIVSTMEDKDDKKRWKEEADQLKKDLDQREKIVKENPVKIQFGGKKSSTASPKKKRPGTASDDDILRRQLGLVD